MKGDYMNAIFNNAAVYRTWLMLKITYAIVPIVIGLDKCFTWLLVDWAKYVSPLVMDYMSVLTVAQFIMVTGVIEILAGVFLWFYPRFGAYVIALWMALVIANLVSMNMFYDIIARDTVIGIGALALAWLTPVQ